MHGGIFMDQNDNDSAKKFELSDEDAAKKVEKFQQNNPEYEQLQQAITETKKAKNIAYTKKFMFHSPFATTPEQPTNETKEENENTGSKIASQKKHWLKYTSQEI